MSSETHTLELRNLKIFHEMSQETYCFQADVFLNGAHMGVARNEGTGGPNSYDWINRQAGQALEALAKAQPPVPSEWDNDGIPAEIDLFVMELAGELDGYMAMKELMEEHPDATLFRLVGDEEGTFRTLDRRYSEALKTLILKQYGDRLEMIANEAFPPFKSLNPVQQLAGANVKAPDVDVIAHKQISSGTVSTSYLARLLILDLFEEEVVKSAAWTNGGMELEGWQGLLESIRDSHYYPSDVLEPDFSVEQSLEVLDTLMASCGMSVVQNSDGSQVEAGLLGEWIKEQSLRVFLDRVVEDCLAIVGYLNDYAVSQVLGLTNVMTSNTFDEDTPDSSTPVDGWPNVLIHTYDGKYLVHEFRVVDAFSIFLFHDTTSKETSES